MLLGVPADLLEPAGAVEQRKPGQGTLIMLVKSAQLRCTVTQAMPAEMAICLQLWELFLRPLVHIQVEGRERLMWAPGLLQFSSSPGPPLMGSCDWDQTAKLRDPFNFSFSAPSVLVAFCLCTAWSYVRRWSGQGSLFCDVFGQCLRQWGPALVLASLRHK